MQEPSERWGFEVLRSLYEENQGNDKSDELDAGRLNTDVENEGDKSKEDGGTQAEASEEKQEAINVENSETPIDTNGTSEVPPANEPAHLSTEVERQPDNSQIENEVTAVTACNYPLDMEVIQYSIYDPQPEPECNLTARPTEGASSFGGMLGAWNCKVYSDLENTDRIFSVTFVAEQSEENELKFRGTGLTIRGVETTWSGTVSRTDDAQVYAVYVTRSFKREHNTQYWRGKIHVEDGYADGTVSWYEEDESFAAPESTFCMARTPLEYLMWRPLPSSLQDNPQKYSLLWKFAGSAIRAKVRRQLWCWEYFHQRLQNRKIWVDLMVRKECYERLSSENNAKLDEIASTLLPMDGRFNFSLVLHEKRLRTDHKSVASRL